MQAAEGLGEGGLEMGWRLVLCSVAGTILGPWASAESTSKLEVVTPLMGNFSM